MRDVGRSSAEDIALGGTLLIYSNFKNNINSAPNVLALKRNFHMIVVENRNTASANCM